jgi:hypothetical protein
MAITKVSIGGFYAGSERVTSQIPTTTPIGLGYPANSPPQSAILSQ